MPAKKTIEVLKILETANHMLQSDYGNEDFRKGVSALLEFVLEESANYSGFNYIEWTETGFDQWKRDNEPSDTTPYLGDQSRRFYYYSQLMQSESKK